jgi:phage gp46-like protein
MTDIRVVTRAELIGTAADWLMLGDGSLDDSHDLATAVMVALGTDRLAEADDVLPDPGSTDRRGWWGDTDVQEIWDGWPIGTRLWLLERAKITGMAAREGGLLIRAEDYVREALQPFIDQRIVSRIDVLASRDGVNAVSVKVVLYRGPLPAIALRFLDLWTESGN